MRAPSSRSHKSSIVSQSSYIGLLPWSEFIRQLWHPVFICGLIFSSTTNFNICSMIKIKIHIKSILFSRQNNICLTYAGIMWNFRLIWKLVLFHCNYSSIIVDNILVMLGMIYYASGKSQFHEICKKNY